MLSQHLDVVRVGRPHISEKLVLAPPGFEPGSAAPKAAMNCPKPGNLSLDWPLHQGAELCRTEWFELLRNLSFPCSLKRVNR